MTVAASPYSLVHLQSPHMALESPLFEGVVVLGDGGEDGIVGCGDNDELFLLPDRVLGMDSLTFREDVAAVAPSLIAAAAAGSSPHNSLDSTDSGKSLRLLDDTEGLRIVRASDGCRTLWLCKRKNCHANVYFPHLGRHLAKATLSEVAS